MTLKQRANALIPKADGNKQVTHPRNATTGDIIGEVLSNYKQCSNDLLAFAPYLRGATTLQTCSNIWHFVKQNIAYVEDEPGVQWIKTPARIWQDKFCDCKGYSVFIACLLNGLNIPGIFSFVSFSPTNPDPTHVLIVVAEPGQPVIKIDCVLNQFNTEKQYTHKQDFKMTMIARLSGIGTAKTSILQTHKFGQPVEFYTGMQPVELLQQGQALEVLQSDMVTEIKAGKMNDLRLLQYQNAIASIRATIEALDSPAVGKGGLKKLFTAGKRRNVKASLQDASIANTFLYMFIPTGTPAGRNLLAQLPNVVAEKRTKQIELANFLAKKSAYGLPTFMADVRAGITSTSGREPEAVLNDLLQLDIAIKEAGIGKLFKKKTPAQKAERKEKTKGFAANLANEGLEAAATAIPFGSTILNVAKGIFAALKKGGKNKIESDFGFAIPANLAPEAIAPAAEDFTAAEETPRAIVLQDQTPLQPPIKLVDRVAVQPRGIENLLNTVADKLANMQAALTDNAGRPTAADYDNYSNTRPAPEDAAETLPAVVVRPNPATPPPADSNKLNPIVWAALGLAAIMVIKK
jgi:hypothetical protein